MHNIYSPCSIFLTQAHRFVSEDTDSLTGVNIVFICIVFKVASWDVLYSCIIFLQMDYSF